MAGFIATANLVETVMQFAYFGQTVLNVFNFLFPAPPTNTDRTALNTAMHTFWTNQLKPTLGGDLQLNQIRSTNQDFAAAPSTTLIISPAEAGTVAGVGLPGGSAYVVTTRTGLRGRSYRGRNYLAGIPTGYLASGNSDALTTTPIANILGAMAWLMTAANTANGVWSVLSKYNNHVPRSSGLATPITAVSGDLYVDSQRRRLTGRGF